MLYSQPAQEKRCKKFSHRFKTSQYFQDIYDKNLSFLQLHLYRIRKIQFKKKKILVKLEKKGCKHCLQATRNDQFQENVSFSVLPNQPFSFYFSWQIRKLELSNKRTRKKLSVRKKERAFAASSAITISLVMNLTHTFLLL